MIIAYIISILNLFLFLFLRHCFSLIQTIMNIYKCLVIFLMAIVFNLNVIKIYCRPQLTPPQQQWCHVPSHCLKAFYNAAMDSIAQKRTRFNLDPLQLDLGLNLMSRQQSCRILSQRINETLPATTMVYIRHYSAPFNLYSLRHCERKFYF